MRKRTRRRVPPAERASFGIKSYPLRVLRREKLLLAKSRHAVTFFRAAISRSAPACFGEGTAARGSHRHRYIVDLRCAIAVRFAARRPGVPAPDNEKAAHQIDHLRAALVFAR